MSKELTEKQKKVLTWIKESVEKEGSAPTVRELQEKLGCASPMGVVSHLRALEQKGQIRRMGNQARGIVVLDGRNIREPHESDVVNIPLVGNVACGMPIYAEELIEDWIPLSTKLVKRSQDVFMLTAKGDSMDQAGIEDGDYIIFKKTSTAENGDKVVVLIGSEATVKKLDTTKGKAMFRPMSSNKEHKVLVPEEGTYMIQGKVIGVIKNFKE